MRLIHAGRMSTVEQAIAEVRKGGGDGGGGGAPRPSSGGQAASSLGIAGRSAAAPSPTPTASASATTPASMPRGDSPPFRSLSSGLAAAPAAAAAVSRTVDPGVLEVARNSTPVPTETNRRPRRLEVHPGGRDRAALPAEQSGARTEADTPVDPIPRGRGGDHKRADIQEKLVNAPQ